MPHLARWTDGVRRFERHLSGGNATRFGIFSLIYGLHGSYWMPFLNEQTPPVLVTSLVEAGWEPLVLSSASMSSPEFRSTAWVTVEDAVLDKLEGAEKYLRDRKAFGHPIGDFQGMRWKAADMLIEVEAGRGLLYRAAVSGDPFPDPTMAAMAKIYCNEMAIRVTSQAVQVHGGYGYVDEFAVSRLFRGARFGSLGGGTTETLRNLVGRRVVEHMDLATGVHSLNMF